MHYNKALVAYKRLSEIKFCHLTTIRFLFHICISPFLAQ